MSLQKFFQFKGWDWALMIFVVIMVLFIIYLT